MKRIFYILAIVPVLIAADDQGGPTTWELSGKQRTAAEITKLLNSELESSWSRKEEDRLALERNQKDVADATAAAIKSAQSDPKYRALLAKAAKAESDLAAARASENSRGVIESQNRLSDARDEIKRLDAIAVKNDALVATKSSFTAGYTKALKDAEESLARTAMWRGKLLHGLQNRFLCGWPIEEGKEVFVRSAIISSMNGDSLVLVTTAQEETGFQKNAIGDGLGIATYTPHLFAIVVGKPGDFSGNKGDTIALGRCYFIGKYLREETAGDYDFACYAASDSTGPLAKLFSDIAKVQGPPKKFMDEIDARVEAEIAKQIKDSSPEGK